MPFLRVRPVWLGYPPRTFFTGPGRGKLDLIFELRKGLVNTQEVLDPGVSSSCDRKNGGRWPHFVGVTGAPSTSSLLGVGDRGQRNAGLGRRSHLK
jgi:hypothetical protein